MKAARPWFGLRESAIILGRTMTTDGRRGETTSQHAGPRANGVRTRHRRRPRRPGDHAARVQRDAASRTTASAAEFGQKCRDNATNAMRYLWPDYGHRRPGHVHRKCIAVVWVQQHGRRNAPNALTVYSTAQ